MPAKPPADNPKLSEPPAGDPKVSFL